MRGFLVAPLLLLLSSTAGRSIEVNQPTSEDLNGAASVHSLCGDDLIPPTTERILPGYGGGGMKIAAKPEAQAFFDNGMQLAHAFTHQAATAAFKESTRLDPLCAMCLWGEAWSIGPTINFPVDAATQVKAGKLLDTAERLAATGSPLEQQMIAALKLRYQNGGGKGSGDYAFARAMDAIAAAHPDSDEILTITADAWMIPSLLTDSKANLPHAIDLLQTVLKRNPDYTPAIHFYIHATETVGTPGMAEHYADRLATLAPSASHLIHMPSHTYYWIGRYHDAADANVRAASRALEDVKAAKLTGEDSIWRLDYHAHNVQFGVGGALISGDAKDALDLAKPMLAALTKKPPQSAYGTMAAGTGYAAMGRFADPAAVLTMPDPGAGLPLERAYWHYARGEAFARQGKADAVRAEAQSIAVPALKANPDKADKAARDMAQIAQLVLMGRAEMADNNPNRAFGYFARATRLEESRIVTYFADPPAWWYPVRRSMAAALFAAGRYDTALTQADAALKRRPNDPVATMLKAEALAKLGKTDLAASEKASAASMWHGDASAFTTALI